jgi:hypothetical protein
MSMPSERDSLWNVARECAAQRAHKCCKNEFGCIECNNCRYYLYNYANAEPAKINLLMLQAEDSVDALIRLNKSGTRTIIAFILLVIAIPIGLYFLANSEWFNGPLTPPAKGVVKAKYSDDESAIWDTLQKVAIGMTKKTDVNKDGKVNCIDAALLFYKYYPYKDRVTIEYNYNPSKDFNHMFNAVFIGGNWIAVEPQAKFCGYDVYRMKPIWDNQYEWTLNRDVTKEWLEYVR